MFLAVQLTISQHLLRKRLDSDQAGSHYLHQWWLDYRRIYASLGLNELINSLWHRQWTGSSSWWRHQMETFSALLALCEGILPVTDGLPSQSSERFSKQWRRRWFETPLCSLWHLCNNFWFGSWLVACSVQNHYLKRCWTFENKLFLKNWPNNDFLSSVYSCLILGD